MYTCFRPAPSALENNKPRALRSFAWAATRYHLRKEAWSKSFFRQRWADRKRFIELHIRNSEYGRPLSAAELQELSRRRGALTAADSRFYHSLAAYQTRRIVAHGSVFCDSCRGPIGGARIICLVCQMKDKFNTVDLCDSPECVGARVVRDDMTKPHLPTHDLMKTRRMVHTRQFGKMDRDAKAALKRARVYFESIKIPDSDESSESTFRVVSMTQKHLSTAQKRASIGIAVGPACAVCKQSVTQPCWYCVQCPDATFICTDCDAKGSADFDGRAATHDLVKCQELMEDVDDSVESRLATLEAQFSKQEVTMDDRLGQLETKVDDRLSRVEKLLESLLRKMDVEAT